MHNTNENSDLHVVLGSGPAGTALAAELADRGRGVRLVDRRGEGPAPDGVERFAADLSDADRARAAVAGAGVVYHAVNVPYELQVEVMPRIQRAIVSAVEAEGARLVVLDTLYPYGETGGRAMTEETPWAATSAKTCPPARAAGKTAPPRLELSTPGPKKSAERPRTTPPARPSRCAAR